MSLPNNPRPAASWCHINEFRHQGYASIADLVAVGCPAVLWGPAWALMERYFEEGWCPVHPNELIDLVEAGHVQIAAREPWLFDEHHRRQIQGRFPAGKWTAYDERIREIAVQDRESFGEPSSLATAHASARVIVAPPERGYQWADQVIGRGDDVVADVRERLKSQRLPPATLEKIAGLPEEEAVRLTLRDLKNHANVQEETSASIPVLPWDDAPFLLQPELFEGEGRGADGLGVEEWTGRQVGAALDLMGRLKAFEPLTPLGEFMESSERQALHDWLSDAFAKAQFCDARNLVDFLALQLAQDIWAGQERRRGIPATGSLLSLIMTVASDGLRFSGELVFGLATMASRPTRGLLEQSGLKPLTYAGPLWPFYCTTGHAPYKQDIERILASLGLSPSR